MLTNIDKDKVDLQIGRAKSKSNLINETKSNIVKNYF